MKALGLPCHICGGPIHYDEPSDAQHPLSFVIDEMKPVSRWREFGYNSARQAAEDWNNLAPAHYICNRGKGARTKEEMENRIKRMAYTPTCSDGEW